jgi:hypothetical protein
VGCFLAGIAVLKGITRKAQGPKFKSMTNEPLAKLL